MLRPFVLLLVVTPLVIAAPPPKGADKKAELYWPTTVGAVRVSETTSGDSTSETTETVTKVDEKDGVFRVTVDRLVGGRAAPTVTFAVSPKGVERVALAGQELATPAIVFRFSAKPGDTWTDATGKATATYTVGKEEEIEVPAGKFTARVVHVQMERANNETGTATMWFAAGIGPVKMVPKSDTSERTTVLKSFTPGK